MSNAAVLSEVEYMEIWKKDAEGNWKDRGRHVQLGLASGIGHMRVTRRPPNEGIHQTRSALIWIAAALAADPPATAPGTRRLWSAALCLAALFVNQGTALAQDDNRGGFTLLINAGYAVQHDSASGKSGDGQAGLNLGIGGFLTRNLALMFRVSETSVRSKAGVLGELNQASGVLGGTLQYWVSDRVAIEAGAGLGFVEDIYQADSPGLILGITATIFNRGKHSLQAGVEYAPAFRQSGTISNVGFTIGYQFL